MQVDKLTILLFSVISPRYKHEWYNRSKILHGYEDISRRTCKVLIYNILLDHDSRE
jgi:hypothetical protein